MKTLRSRILSLLSWIPGGDAGSIAEDLGVSEEIVQPVVHQMDDDGELIMRGGWYRLSQAARQRIQQGGAA